MALIVLTAVVALAVMAQSFGADSRDFERHSIDGGDR
jgi:hypothetical protein